MLWDVNECFFIFFYVLEYERFYTSWICWGYKRAKNKTVAQFCNLKQFFKKTLKIFHSYNLDLALFPSGRKPHKPRHKHKGKSKYQFGLPFPHLPLEK